MKGKKLISTLKAQEKNVSRVSSIIPQSPSLKWLDQSRNFHRVDWLTPLIHDTINNSQFLKYNVLIFDLQLICSKVMNTRESFKFYEHKKQTGKRLLHFISK